MTAEELSKKLGITKPGEQTEVGYVVNLDNSDEFAKVYTLLDNCSYCTLNTDNMLLSDSNSMFNYFTDDFVIDLVGNFDEDTYKVVFKEIA